jgi:prepilin-type N-terminal cleavage/methylation domain-containing protein
MKQKIGKKIKGFTLLEILLVIAAIGILAAIVLVAINPNRQIGQVRNAQRRADVNTIYKAIEQYLIDTGSYPAGITTTLKDICQTGTEQVGGATTCTNKADLRVLVPNYIAGIPVEPAGGAYRVSINEENNRIRVRASNAELGQIIVVNPAVEERIQAQISAGTLVVTATQALVEGRLVYANNAGTQTYIDRPTTTITCPSNYIPVPGNSLYGTSDFCVMKYEAKTGSSTVAATTAATGFPTVNISQTNAITACSLNGAGYGLINNNEWMTIARNIEAQPSNWTGGTVGSGGLWLGHSDNSPGSTLAASTDDNLGYTGTGNTSPSIEKRTHTLSNGETIWDLGGNVWEWTNNTILGKDQPTGSTPGFNWRQWTAITIYGTLSYDLTRPSNTSWNSSQNMGQIYSDGTSTNNTNFAFLRGGGVGPTNAGVFTLDLISTPSFESFFIGFRCVLR